MSKVKYARKESKLINQNEYNILIRKYYTLYMNSVKCDELDEEALRFFLNQLWEEGSIAAYNLPAIKDLAFAPFAPAGKRNHYGVPTTVDLIDLWGVGRGIIPYAHQKVNKDVVLIYALAMRIPIRRVVEYQVERICEVRRAMRMNLKVNMIPYFIKTSNINDKRLENIMNDIYNGSSYVPVTPEDATELDDAIILNPPYIIDKLQVYETQLENELLTFLGINNIGVQEKKERMITDEVESNNELIAIWGECYMSELNKATKKIKDILGHDIKFNDTTPAEIEEIKEEE